MKIKKYLLVLSFVAFTFTAQANFFTDGKNIYHIYKSNNGLIIASNKYQINLNKNCNAFSKKLGAGSWGHKEGITVVKLSNLTLKLKPRMPLNLAYCKKISFWDKIFGE